MADDVDVDADAEHAAKENLLKRFHVYMVLTFNLIGIPYSTFL